MKRRMPPWTKGPFEIIFNAETHYRRGEDYDRRLALIGFDNSIEVSVTVYLHLHPIQRNGRQYPNKNVEAWNSNFHSKIDFIEEEASRRGVDMVPDKGEIVWCHRHRNEQYHGATLGVPDLDTLRDVRHAALWVFEFLFELDNVENEIEMAYEERFPPKDKYRDGEKDGVIDENFGVVEVAGAQYPASDILFHLDPDYYTELGDGLLEEARGSGQMGENSD